MIFTTEKAIRAAALKMMDIGTWGNPFAVTLTLKQAYYEGNNRVALSAYDAEQNLRHFLNLLNRAAHGKAAVRSGQKLKCIAVREDGNVRPHFHLCIDKPSHLSNEHFVALIETCWRKTRFGYGQTDIRPCDGGWVQYITKHRTKSAYADSIDWLNFHNTDRAV